MANTIDAPATVATTPVGGGKPDVQPVESSSDGDISKDIKTPDLGDGGGEGGEGDSTGSDVKDALKNAADQVKQKFEFIVDGKAVTKEYSPSQIKQMLQKAEGADRRFQDASRLERMNQELLWLAKNDPAKLLSHNAVGVDPYKWAEDLLYKKIQLEQMDPKDRELMEKTERLRIAEERTQTIERQIQQEKLQKAIEYERANHSRDIHTSLKESGMPINNFTVKRTAHYMLEAMNMNVKVSAKEVLPLVMEDYKAEQQALFQSSDEDSLAAILGEENLKKLRKYEMKRLKVQDTEKGEKRNTSLRPSKPGEKKMSMEEFRERNERIKRGEE